MSDPNLGNRTRKARSGWANGRVPVFGADGIVAYALVDEADADLVRHERWHLDHDGAVWCHPVGRPRSTVKMHRRITGARRGQDVDHINHDRLDNRRANLRRCTHAQNMMNMHQAVGQSGYRGVRLMPGGRWHARIRRDYRDVHLGAFATREEAWAARRAAELRLLGEFAPAVAP